MVRIVLDYGLQTVYQDQIFHSIGVMLKMDISFLENFGTHFRLINIHIEEYKPDENVAFENLNPIKWILSKLNHLVVKVTDNLEKYNFAEARNSIQSFIWHDFCDEYIEAVKYRLYTDSEDFKDLKTLQGTP